MVCVVESRVAVRLDCSICESGRKGCSNSRVVLSDEGFAGGRTGRRRISGGEDLSSADSGAVCGVDDIPVLQIPPGGSDISTHAEGLMWSGLCVVRVCVAVELKEEESDDVSAAGGASPAEIVLVLAEAASTRSMPASNHVKLSRYVPFAAGVPPHPWSWEFMVKTILRQGWSPRGREFDVQMERRSDVSGDWVNGMA
jgi:hypothetical protein